MISTSKISNLVFTLGNQPGLAVHPSSEFEKTGIESKLEFVKTCREQRLKGYLEKDKREFMSQISSRVWK